MIHISEMQIPRLRTLKYKVDSNYYPRTNIQICGGKEFLSDFFLWKDDFLEYIYLY